MENPSYFTRKAHNFIEGKMETTKMVCIERTSSIEKEPRTLNLDQIHFAREAALFVLNTLGVEEAMRIFTQGLEPVECCVRDKKEETADYTDNKDASSTTKDRYPNLERERDIASAPF